MTTTNPELIPVIVGVGQCNDRPANLQEGLNSTGLMEKALRLADIDAGRGWLADIDSLAVVKQISWPNLGDIATDLSSRFQAHPRFSTTTPEASGDSPIRLLNDAANLIGCGSIKVAAIVGGEALRTAAQLAKAAAAVGEAADYDPLRDASAEVYAPGYREKYGLAVPTDVYPLYENAGRKFYGQTLAEGQAESATIWSNFAEVAKHNPAAWLRKGAAAEEICTPSLSNRPIAHPYTKLMVANSSVNQGAGFIVTSLAEARRRGVAESKIIYVGLGASAHEPEDVLARDRFFHSVSMETSINTALRLNDLQPQDLSFVELYSCFPCVPKMARRILSWPASEPATVSGGLTFGGGPIGNYMSHTVASMVEKLRIEGRHGLLFANGGLATHNHTIILSNSPVEGAEFPQDYDYQAQADSKRGKIPVVIEEYVGPATLETYTVLYNRDGSARSGVVVARTPEGARTLAIVSAGDQAAIRLLTSGEVEAVGSTGVIESGLTGLRTWNCT